MKVAGKKFVKEFRDFALRGNVFDMAVGVIIGNEFGKIVNSLVKDVLTPLFSLVIGKIDVSDWKIEAPSSLSGGAPVVIHYGFFLQMVINFVIVAFCIFLAIKGMMTLRHYFNVMEENKKKIAPPPTPTETLLAEIRDLLKKNAEP